MIKALEKVEMLLYKKASRITAVTNGVKDNIVSKVFWGENNCNNQWRGHGNLFS